MFITAMSDSVSKGKSVFRRGLAIVLMGMIFLTSAFSVAALSKTVVISVDDQSFSVNTMSSNTDEILENAGVNVGPYDIITSTEENNTLYIGVQRAFDVVLNVRGESKTFQFANGTVADVLKKANVVLNDNTAVTPDKTTKLTENMKIEVIYLKDVVLNDGGKSKTVKVPEGNVKDALAYLQVQVNKDDKVNVKLTDVIKDNMKITITRVQYKDVKSKEAVPFETVTTYTDELQPGETKTVTKGVKGEKDVITRQKIVNGKVAQKKVIKETLSKKPVNAEVLEGEQIITTSYTTSSSGSSSASNSYGAAGVPVSANNGVLRDAQGNEVSYSNVHHGSGTAYYAPAGALTATGTPVYVGGVAVNPNIIPYGSKLYIVADDGFVYGYATAIDTGGALMSGDAIVDVFYYTYDECVNFGRRNVSVYVLN